MITSKLRLALSLALLLVPLGLLFTADIPLDLPLPDGKPGGFSKAVQVYILAGQSNMVGMGDLSGSRPLSPSIFLSADPNVIAGWMPVSGSAVAKHGIYQSTDIDAESGATVRLYRGELNLTADYSLLIPVKTTTVALGTVSAKLISAEFSHTGVATALIDVPAIGRYQVHAGFGDSSYAVVLLDGQPVYRRDFGESADLETGFWSRVSVTRFRFDIGKVVQKPSGANRSNLKASAISKQSSRKMVSSHISSISRD